MQHNACVTAFTPAPGFAALVATSVRRHGLSGFSGTDDLLARARRWGPDVEAGATAVFGDAAPVLLTRLADIVVEGWLVRPQPLRERDRDRTLRPDWFQQPDALGYVAYADRFGGTLDGVAQHVDYLR